MKSFDKLIALADKFDSIYKTSQAAGALWQVEYKQISDTDTIKKYQQALNSAGFKIAVDGSWGTESDKALKAFQQKNSISPSGWLDSKTKSLLNVPASTSTADEPDMF